MKNSLQNAAVRLTEMAQGETFFAAKEKSPVWLLL